MLLRLPSTIAIDQLLLDSGNRKPGWLSKLIRVVASMGDAGRCFGEAVQVPHLSEEKTIGIEGGPPS